MSASFSSLPTELQSAILDHLPNDHISTHTSTTSDTTHSTSSSTRFSKPLLDAARVSQSWCLLSFEILWTRGYGCIYGRDRDVARERFRYSCYQWNLARSVGAQWAVAVRRYDGGGRVVRCHVCGTEQTVVGEENLVDVVREMGI